MRVLAGLLTLVAGLSFGLHEFYLSPAERDSVSARLPGAADLKNIDPFGPASRQTASAPRHRVFSPASPLFSSALADKILAEEKARADAARTAAAVGGGNPEIRGWTAVARVLDQSSESWTSLTPDTDAAQYKLAVELQRELKRVGCYWGHLDGSWGARTKRAVSAFMTQVNAALPTERPDYALLALVKAHSGPVCGGHCEQGQVVARDGRCLPSTIVARTTTPATTVTARATPPPDTPGEVAAPVPRPALARRRESTTSVAAVEPANDLGAVIAAPLAAPHASLMTLGGRVPAVRSAGDAPVDPPGASPTQTAALEPATAEADEALPAPGLPRANATPAIRARPRVEASRPRSTRRVQYRAVQRVARSFRPRLPSNRRYVPPPSNLIHGMRR